MLNPTAPGDSLFSRRNAAFYVPVGCPSSWPSVTDVTVVVADLVVVGHESGFAADKEAQWVIKLRPLWCQAA